MRQLLLGAPWLLLPACSGSFLPGDRHDPGTDDSAPADSDPHIDTSDTGSPAPPDPWSFAVFGDNQFATTSCTSGVDERLAIPELVLSLQPTLLLHTGDLMDHGYEDGAYDQLQSCYAGMLAEIPFFPTPGNHDMGSGGIERYEAYLEHQLFERNPETWDGDWAAEVAHWYEDDPNSYSEDFDHPANTENVPSGVSYETFYAVKVKNAYILSFEQGTRWWTNTPRSWLEDHLAIARSDPSVEHVFVIMHHPMYSTTMAEGGDGEAVGPVREDYEDLFRAYDVTVAFSGHAHVYEHFEVPDDGHSTRRDGSAASYVHDGSAVHYVVTGGGGGPLPGCDPMGAPIEDHSAGYLQGRACGYHATRVQVDGHRLTVSTHWVDGGAGAWSTGTWETWSLE